MSGRDGEREGGEEDRGVGQGSRQNGERWIWDYVLYLSFHIPHLWKTGSGSLILPTGKVRTPSPTLSIVMGTESSQQLRQMRFLPAWCSQSDGGGRHRANNTCK